MPKENKIKIISVLVSVVGIYNGFPNKLRFWNCSEGVVFLLVFFIALSITIFLNSVYVMLFTYKNDTTTIPYLQGQHHIRNADKVDVSLKIDVSRIKKGIIEHVSFIIISLLNIFGHIN